MVGIRVSEQPRLLFCTFDVLPSPSGASRRLTSFIQAASERYQVVVLSTKTQDHSHIERYHGARLLRVPVGAGDLASRIQAFDRAVRRQVDSEDYALAHFSDPFGGYPLCELRGHAGYRLVYDAVSFPSMELGALHPHVAGDRRFLAKVRRQELYCLMNSDRVLTGSEVTRRFIEQLGVAAAHVQLARTPVDLAAYPQEPPILPDRTPMKVLYLGNELIWQGLPLLLHALEKALPRAPMTLSLLTPPHPEWHGQLQDLIEEKGLAQVVTLLPPVPHARLPPVLLDHDACVVPLLDCDRNRLQGGALAKVSEALAAGRPVIASDLPICRELCPIDGSVFFKAGDASSLADRLVELGNNARLRVALGASARAYAERHVDEKKVVQAVLKLEEELVGAGPRAPHETPEALAPTPTLRLMREELPKTDPVIRLPAGIVRSAARRKPLRPKLSAAGQTDPPSAVQTATGAPPATGTPPVAPRGNKVPPAGATPPVEARAPRPAPPPALPREPPTPMAEEPILSSDDLVAPDESPNVFEAAFAVDPWFAQLLFGYCPPEGAHFARHTPPTNFPGRDDVPPVKR
jgi:glycosyltransferase involved in cell wall biosynthesis